VTFHFVFDYSDYPYDKKIRPQKRIPHASKDVSTSLMGGWAESRMLTDGDGHVARNRFKITIANQISEVDQFSGD